MPMFKLTPFLCFLFPWYGFTQTPQIPFAPKHYVCYHTPTALTIDGHLDETVWQNATWTDTFVDIEGDLKPRPQHPR